MVVSPTIVKHNIQRWAQRVYHSAAYVFAGGVALQVFLAAMNIFATPVYWSAHSAVGHALGLFIISMLVLMFPARLAASLKWQTVLLFGLMAVQYFVFPLARAVGLPGLSALHAVNALALFWLALHLAKNQETHQHGTSQPKDDGDHPVW